MCVSLQDEFHNFPVDLRNPLEYTFDPDLYKSGWYILETLCVQLKPNTHTNPSLLKKVSSEPGEIMEQNSIEKNCL